MNKPTVRAAVIPSPGRAVEIHELPLPELEPDSALLRVSLSEVCGTDVHLQHGRLAGVPYPLVPGHFSVGRIEQVRGRVLDVDHRPICEGDAVTFLDVHRTCGECWYCLVAKASTRCPRRKVYGITYGLDDGWAGGWCDVVYLRPGTRVIPLAGVGMDRFMAGGCGLPTAVHAVERAEIRLADAVLVLGTGPVGLSAIALASGSGAGRVLAIGGPCGRLAAATAMGAAETLDVAVAGPAERLEWIRARTGGRGADIVIEATGAPAAVAEAMRYARDAGRVVIVGQYTDCGEVTLNPHVDLNKKHLDVRGCWGSDFSHVYRGLEYLRHGALAGRWDAIETTVYDLEQVQAGLDAVAAGSVVKALVKP